MKEHGPNDKRLTLLEEWKISEEPASTHAFKDKVAVARTGNPHTAHIRIDCSVNFSVEYVLVSSVEIAKAFCSGLMNRHRLSNTVIGPHIVSLIKRLRTDYVHQRRTIRNCLPIWLSIPTTRYFLPLAHICREERIPYPVQAGYRRTCTVYP